MQPARSRRIPDRGQRFLAVLTLLLTTIVGCRVSDVRTVTIRVPGMRCAACQERVVQALTPLEGVHADTLAFDLATGTVIVTYESMLVAIKNLEHAIADAGYAVVTQPYPLPADPAAFEALPDACRDHPR